MSKEVRQESNIPTFLYEILGKTMSKRVGIHHFRINVIAKSKIFQLIAYPRSGDGIFKPI